MDQYFVFYYEFNQDSEYPTQSRSFKRIDFLSFNIYINDLPKKIIKPCGMPLSYADDLAVVCDENLSRKLLMLLKNCVKKAKWLSIIKESGIITIRKGSSKRELLQSFDTDTIVINFSTFIMPSS